MSPVAVRRAHARKMQMELMPAEAAVNVPSGSTQ